MMRRSVKQQGMMECCWCCWCYGARGCAPGARGHAGAALAVNIKNGLLIMVMGTPSISLLST